MATAGWSHGHTGMHAFVRTSHICSVDAILTTGMEGVGQQAALVLGGGAGVESVGYALTVAGDGQMATTAPCETFGSPSLASRPACSGGATGDMASEAGEIVQVQVSRLELILLTDVFAA